MGVVLVDLLIDISWFFFVELDKRVWVFINVSFLLVIELFFKREMLLIFLSGVILGEFSFFFFIGVLYLVL